MTDSLVLAGYRIELLAGNQVVDSRQWEKTSSVARMQKTCGLPQKWWREAPGGRLIPQDTQTYHLRELQAVDRLPAWHRRPKRRRDTGR